MKAKLLYAIIAISLLLLSGCDAFCNHVTG